MNSQVLQPHFLSQASPVSTSHNYPQEIGQGRCSTVVLLQTGNRIECHGAAHGQNAHAKMTKYSAQSGGPGHRLSVKCHGPGLSLPQSLAAVTDTEIRVKPQQLRGPRVIALGSRCPLDSPPMLLHPNVLPHWPAAEQSLAGKQPGFHWSLSLAGRVTQSRLSVHGAYQHVMFI